MVCLKFVVLSALCYLAVNQNPERYAIDNPTTFHKIHFRQHALDRIGQCFMNITTHGFYGTNLHKGLSEEMEELIQMLHNNCKEETGVDEEVIVAARNLNFAEDEKLKCYMRCIMIQMATMDDDGIIDIEATIALLPDELKDKLTPPLNKCGTVIGVNHCDNAFQTNKCWANEVKNEYWLV